ncbi:hypothetical protein PIB30_091950 [Stylosanthes scabra]|uniref:Uncharacterized protein n=1 Tax=Stylosanthes scabra TaxID=79078 RepID=A0ABU6QV67_9FABA|nr:hypothetical protein [Stylosanthes scabra]
MCQLVSQGEQQVPHWKSLSRPTPAKSDDYHSKWGAYSHTDQDPRDARPSSGAARYGALRAPLLHENLSSSSFTLSNSLSDSPKLALAVPSHLVSLLASTIAVSLQFVSPSRLKSQPPSPLRVSTWSSLPCCRRLSRISQYVRPSKVSTAQFG